MSKDQTSNDVLAGEEEGPVLPRRRVKDTAELDITPMIDIVFLLLIFFLVASIPDVQIAADLPRARHGEGVNPRTAVIITIAEPDGPGRARVFLSDGKIGTPLPDDPDEQAKLIRQAVEEGFRSEGKSAVLVKAEKRVPYREDARVVDAVASADVENVQLYFAVFEIR